MGKSQKYTEEKRNRNMFRKFSYVRESEVYAKGVPSGLVSLDIWYPIWRSWEHWSDAEGHSVMCTAEFAKGKGATGKIKGTCEYCDDGVKVKPRFHVDVFTEDNDLVAINLNIPSLDNLLNTLDELKKKRYRLSDFQFKITTKKEQVGSYKANVMHFEVIEENKEPEPVEEVPDTEKDEDALAKDYVEKHLDVLRDLDLDEGQLVNMIVKKFTNNGVPKAKAKKAAKIAAKKVLEATE